MIETVVLVCGYIAAVTGAGTWLCVTCTCIVASMDLDACFCLTAGQCRPAARNSLPVAILTCLRSYTRLWLGRRTLERAAPATAMMVSTSVASSCMLDVHASACRRAAPCSLHCLSMCEHLLCHTCTQAVMFAPCLFALVLGQHNQPPYASSQDCCVSAQPCRHGCSSAACV